MADALAAAAGAVVILVALGLIGLLKSGGRPAAPAQLLTSIQLLGSGVVAALLLLAFALPDPALLDAALALALLSAFAAAALQSSLAARRGDTPAGGE